MNIQITIHHFRIPTRKCKKKRKKVLVFYSVQQHTTHSTDHIPSFTTQQCNINNIFRKKTYIIAVTLPPACIILPTHLRPLGFHSYFSIGPPQGNRKKCTINLTKCPLHTRALCILTSANRTSDITYTITITLYILF